MSVMTSVLVAMVMAPPPVKAPKLYAPLLVKGNAWVYSVKHTELRDFNEKGKPRLKEVTRLTVACKVARTATFKGAVASEITCVQQSPEEKMDRPLALKGVYVANAKGLWKVELDWPLKPAEVGRIISGKDKDKVDEFYAAKLRKGVKRLKKHPDTNPDGESSVQTYPFKRRIKGRKGKRQVRGWCVNSSTIVGDESVTRLCFSAKVGVVEAGSEFHGGFSNLTVMTLRNE